MDRAIKLIQKCGILIDFLFIILGFVLMKSVNLEDEEFYRVENVLLVVGIGFLVMHFEAIKEIAKKEKKTIEDIGNYKGLVVELVLMGGIAYLIFIMYLFKIECLKYYILSLSFGLFSAFAFSLIIFLIGIIRIKKKK